MPNVPYKQFFPLDYLGWDDRLPCLGGKLPGQACTPWNYTDSPKYDLNHNFLFTTTFVRKFKYIAQYMNTHFIHFSGDDDVWGYVCSDEDSNYAACKLVIDLGGVHPKETTGVWLGAAKDGLDGLNLIDGKVYTLKLFQAEQQCCASNFIMYAPMTECLCTPSDGGEAFGVEDDRFPRQCRLDPMSKDCDGHTFDYEEQGAMVVADSAFANGITTGIPAHAACKTCHSECAGTAPGQTCAVCPECKADANGNVKCMSH